MSPTNSLVEKVNSIEQDLLRLASTSCAESLSSTEEEHAADVNNDNGNGEEQHCQQIYTWPTFKKNRAIVAALLTSTAFAAAALTLFSALCYFFGVKGCVVVWLACEGVFWVFQWMLFCKLNAQPRRHESDSHDGWNTFRRFLRASDVRGSNGAPIFNAQTYVSEWFLGAPIEEVKRENMLELLAYGFWYKTRRQMVEDGMGKVPEEMLGMFERVVGVHFQEGYNPKLRYMAHLWEDLHCAFRPLCFYILTEFTGILCRSILTALGCERSSPGHPYTTYTFPGKTAFHCMALPSSNRVRSTSKPIVFLHGVGLGVLPYLDFITSLVCTGHPIVVLEYRHVSMQLVTQIPSCAEVAAVVVSELDRLRIPDACFVAHSYGTFVLTRIVKAHAERVHACCFLDPVCLGMFLPDLLRRFVYLPGRMTSLLGAIRDTIRLCVSREMGIAATMARRFAWSEINLWPEDLYPHRSLLVFSGKDVLVPSKEMIPLIQHDAHRMRSVKVLHQKDLAHGEFLVLSSWKLKIVQEIYSLASSDFERTKKEAQEEKVARRKSLMLSLDAMQNVENPFFKRMDATFLDSVRRTLSLPWKFERCDTSP